MGLKLELGAACLGGYFLLSSSESSSETSSAGSCSSGPNPFLVLLSLSNDLGLSSGFLGYFGIYSSLPLLLMDISFSTKLSYFL